MIDDMNGMFFSASSAYEAGRAAGADDALREALARVASVSVKHEKDRTAEAFHAAEECCAAVVAVRRGLEAQYQISAAALKSRQQSSGQLDAALYAWKSEEISLGRLHEVIRIWSAKPEGSS